MKKITLFLLLGLMTTITWSQVFIDEDFSDGTLPSGWTNNDIEGNGQDWQFNNPGNETGNPPINAPFAILDSGHYGMGNSQNAALETPAFDVSSASTVLLDFDYYFNSYSTSAIFVEVYDGSSWNQVFTMTGTSSTNPAHFTQDITADLNGAADAQVRFRYTGSWAFYWIVDNVLIQNVTCALPTDLTVDGTTSTTADISWTPGGSETSWVVKYSDDPSFDPVSEGYSKDVSGSPSTQLTMNLTPGITYNYYVKAECDGGDESPYVGPMSFTTDCAPISGFSENFDNTEEGDVPNCFNNITVNSTSSTAYNSVQPFYQAPSLPNAYYFSNSGDANAEFYLVSPELDNISDNDHRLRFKFKGPSTASNMTVKVGTMTNASDESTFTSLETVPITNDFDEYTVDFDQSSTGSHIAFKVTFSSTSLTGRLDNLNWEPISTCPKPTDLTVEEETAHTTDLSWTPGGDETQWEVLYGEAGFNPGEAGQSVTVNDDPQTTLIDLEPDMDYDVYVRALCGEDNTSDWTGPESFTTESESEGSYCEGSDFNDEFGAIENFSTSDGAVDIDNQNIMSSLGYRDFTDMNVSQEAGGSFTFTATIKETFIVSDAGVAVYIDYNNDYEFDQSEKVYDSNGFISTATATLTISENTDPGNYRFRIVSDWDNPSPDPCDAVSSIHDYTLTVIGEVEECEVPTNLAAINVDENSAEISWTPGGDETQWEVLYGEEGFDTENEGQSLMVNDGADTTLTDLEADTPYEVYVRAVCDDDSMSDWTGAESFTTESSESGDYCTPIYNVTCNSGIRIDKITLEGESVTLQNPSGCSADNYGDFTDLTPPNLLPGETYSLTVKSNYALFQFEEVKVWIDYNDNGSFEESEKIADTDGNGLSGNSETFDFTVPDSSTPGNYRMRVRLVYFYTDFTPCSEEDSGEAEDYTIEVVSPNACSTPEDINLESITATSVNVSWTAGGAETQWEVLYGEAGFSPGDAGQSVTVNDDPQTTLSDLEPNTDYDVYVRAVCGEDNVSDWTGPESFTTEMAPCEMPTDISINADDITDSSADVSWTSNGDETQWEVLYGETGFNPGEAGQSVTVNDDPQTTLSDLEPNTDYDVYVRAVCGEDNMSDWTGPESFTTEMEPCGAPTDITFSNNDNLSIDVSWTPAGSETQWEVLYGEAGFNPGDAGQSVTVNDGPQTTLSDLDPDTDYDVYVRAVCGEDNVSDWAGPANFLDVNRQVFESFTYYPNPVKGQLTLKANAPIESVTVFNLLGQEVISVNPNTLEAQVNTEDLQAAVYLMKVNINGSSKTFRIVKE